MKTLFTGFLFTLCCASAATGNPRYTITLLGLTDAEHTREDNYRFSQAYNLNEAGQAAGRSGRFNDGSDFLGSSAWLYDGTTTTNIGMTGVEHTRNDDYKSSSPIYLNEAGLVVGASLRYSGSDSLGKSIWLYNGATTIDVGMTGVEHTRNDGYKGSGADYLNEAGQVMGHAERYGGGSDSLGTSVWLYDGTTSFTVGLTGVEHTRNDDSKISLAIYLNEAGQVAGYSRRYNGSNSWGYSAWLYDGTTTIDVGLTSGEYTRNDNYKLSEANSLNEAGQVAGYSDRFSGSTPRGRSAWLYDGTTTFVIGLTGPEHTRNFDYKFSETTSLNEAGQVTGRSERFSGSTSRGYSAWLYNGTTTIDVGLTGGQHTRNDGYKNSQTNYLNEVGQVVGHSNRYLGGASRGQSAWLYDGITTIDVGLTGMDNTSSGGTRYSEARHLNEGGQVAGFSRRYSGSSTMGTDAWLYDPILDQTFSMQFSVRSDGYANSFIRILIRSSAPSLALSQTAHHIIAIPLIGVCDELEGSSAAGRTKAAGT